MKKNWSVIFTAISCVGVVATTALSFRAGLKYEKFLDGDFKEKAKIAGPAIGAGVITIGASIAAHKVNAKAIAGLTAAVALGADRLKAINAVIDEKYSKEEATDIRMKAADKMMEESNKESLEDPERLFCLRANDNDIFFRSTTPKVLKAVAQVNRELFDCSVGCGEVTISDFLTWVDHPELKTKKTDKAGWSVDLLSIECDCFWLEFWITTAKKLHKGEKLNVIEPAWDPQKDIEASYKDAMKRGVL